MPKISKSDEGAKISQNEARRRKEVALARLREMETDERVSVVRAALCTQPETARSATKKHLPVMVH